MKFQKQTLKMLAVVAGVMLLAQAAGADSVELSLEKSGQLRAGKNAAKAYDFSDPLYVDVVIKDLLAFDLSPLDGVNFEATEVTLSLYCSAISAENVTTSVYAISQANGDWEGSTASWNDKNNSTGTDWAGSEGLGTAGVDYTTLLNSRTLTSDDVGTWVAFTFAGDSTSLTALVKSWMTSQNAGVLLQKDDDTARATYRGSTYSPKMNITYNVVPEPATMAMLGLGGVMMLVRRRRNAV